MKKIIIFSSLGGGGHVSVVQSLRACLGNSHEIKYEIKDVETVHDILAQVDTINRLSQGKYSGLTLYNYLLKNNLIFLCNLVTFFAKFFIKWNRKKITRVLHDYIAQEKPDLVISVIPLFNSYIGAAADQNNVPFLIIPSDANTEWYMFDCKNFSDKTFATLHFDIPVMRNHYINSGIKKENIAVVGAPIRHTFLEEKNKQELKAKWRVATGDPVVLLIMGAQGSSSVLSYCRELAKLKTKSHVFICVGKNSKLKNQILDTIPFPAHIALHVIEFTQEIDELMAIADILITKTGGVGVCEALYMNLPMLLDATATTLSWERYNYELILKNKCGQKITEFKKVAPCLDYLLTHQEIILSMRTHMINFSKKDSSKEILEFIKRILKQHKQH
jgi:processive 1,2-diacylglycerol beta-glucosyltransferase